MIAPTLKQINILNTVSINKKKSFQDEVALMLKNAEVKQGKLEKVSIGHGCPHQKCHSEKGYICNCDRYMELSQGQIMQKPNKQELSSFFMTHRPNVMHAPVKFHKIPIWLTSYCLDMVYYKELSQGQIIKKTNKQELSSFFKTHHLNVMHAPVKFPKYIPYCLGVMART